MKSHEFCFSCGAYVGNFELHTSSCIYICPTCYIEYKTQDYENTINAVKVYE